MSKIITALSFLRLLTGSSSFVMFTTKVQFVSKAHHTRKHFFRFFAFSGTPRNRQPGLSSNDKPGKFFGRSTDPEHFGEGDSPKTTTSKYGEYLTSRPQIRRTPSVDNVKTGKPSSFRTDNQYESKRFSSDVDDYLSNDEAKLYSDSDDSNRNPKRSADYNTRQPYAPRSSSGGRGVGARSGGAFPSGPMSTGGRTRNEVKFDRDSSRNSAQKTNSFFSRNDAYQWRSADAPLPVAREEDREPVYGYYDGDHLYGIAPVRLALRASRRNITELLLQEGMELANKKDQKSAKEIIDLAKSMDIPTREFSKHDLNMLTENRPHQGFVLRAAPLSFTRQEALQPSTTLKTVLALDEVWDPQNLGALLRTCHFLSCDHVVVCAKNSAPLSPVVSKASAGAMELMTIGATNNMMKFLDDSRQNGWQVVGTALEENSIDLKDVSIDKPTILVLGNEGHGIRTNVLRRCDVFVRISGQNEAVDVDSLNVSVTGGILLHHFLSKR